MESRKSSGYAWLKIEAVIRTESEASIAIRVPASKNYEHSNIIPVQWSVFCSRVDGMRLFKSFNAVLKIGLEKLLGWGQDLYIIRFDTSVIVFERI